MSLVLHENALFTMSREQYETKPFFHFVLKSNANATQHDFEAMSQALSSVCEANDIKHSVILDAGALKQKEVVKVLCKLDMKNVCKISNKTLDKFIIVTESKHVRALSSSIIALKKAKTYTFTVSSLQDALSLL